MLEIRVHPGKNRLYLSMHGDVTKEDLILGQPRFAEALERLRPGFDIVNDVSGLISLDPLAEQIFTVATESVRAVGMRRVVRVVGRSVEAAALFERMNRKIGFGSALLAYSLEEADRVLDTEARRSPEL